MFLIGMLILTAKIAKSKPIFAEDRKTAFKRAKSLDNGINVSWLEQTWNKDILEKDAITADDLELLKKLGFKSIRLPVAFTHFQSRNVPNEQVYATLDKIWKLCRKHGFKLVIVYHYGNLNDDNYLTETPKIIATWSDLTNRYRKEDHDGLLFDIYNEPPHMNPQVWKDAAYNIVTAVHQIDPKRTLLVGASNFNSIYELSRTERLADENIIYSFHFYEPFFFTHQGADWVGAQVATIGVPFPYNEEKFPVLNPRARGTWGETNYNQYRNDGNERSINDKLQIVKAWGDKYDVPLICSEYGVYNKYADIDSRCRYIRAMRDALKKINVPGMLWDYNSNFSIFTGEPSIVNLPDCMKEAIGYKNK